MVTKTNLFDNMLSLAIRTVLFGYAPCLFVLDFNDCCWIAANLFAALTSGEFDPKLGVISSVFG